MHTNLLKISLFLGLSILAYPLEAQASPESISGSTPGSSSGSISGSISEPIVASPKASGSIDFSSSSQISPELVVYQEYFDPPGEDAPPESRAAGARSGQRCSANESVLRPLMPDRNFSLTLAERPTIFVEVPEQPTAQSAILTIRDEAQTVHARVTLAIDSKDGIAAFQLPSDQPTLASGKNYRWSLVILCHGKPQPDDPVLSGWLQRVERTAAIEQQLESSTPLEQAQWYGEHGYWYDMLQTLLAAGYNDSQTWTTLMTSYVSQIAQ